MEQEDNRSSIKRELAAKEEQIKSRLDSLENEIVSIPVAIKSAIVKNPIIGIAAAIAIGALVGIVFGGRKKKRSSIAPTHQALVEGYITALAEEVRKGVRRGKDPDEVIRKSLRSRAPLIVYTPAVERPESEESGGMIRQIGDLVLKTALGFAVKTGIDVITASLNVKGIQKMMALEDEDRRMSANPPHSHTGDGASEPSSLTNEPLDH